MAKGPCNNAYEEARKQRLEENYRRFQELGVAKIAENLNEKLIKIKNKSLAKDQVKKTTVTPGPLRRSSRPRTEITSYNDEKFVPDSPRLKRLRSSSSTGYIAKRIATKAQQSYPLTRAKRFQSRLSGHPSCVKSLRHSHVSKNFVLNVPHEFCNDHFPDEKLTIELEDEEGSIYDTNYLREYATFKGGWKSFVMDHELDDGDALVLELTEPRRLKVYIFRVPNGHGVSEAKVDEIKKAKKNSVKKVKDSGADEDMPDLDAEQITRPRERITRR